ncbi:hypothetical protein OIU80_20555 [Flavobacterium sp. LS1R47]|uniref:Uncharacterized protein n=1 Tax=Flavobacterium frigoritolerans TaxID=2987686 RepID=A0A9X3CAM2_9FLAO|nr:hypothetical protein [Flavobacterium frigoritolerans]MCV9934679.1 hypothetical protein [Flavobacterium frigoritolerans]
MISKKEKRLLIEILGRQYTPKVMPYLKKKGLKNEKGKPFYVESIRMITNGFRENELVELAIMQLVNKTILEKKAMALKRKKLSKK